MLHQDGRGGLFETCARRGTGIICYGPLGFGLLTGAVTAETDFGDDDWRAGGHGISVYQEMFAPGRLEANLGLVDSLRPMAARLAVTLGQLALAWALHQRGVTGAIAGSRSPEHTRENARAGSVELTTEDLAELESLLSKRA